jgi:hypothetical protein
MRVLLAGVLLLVCVGCGGNGDGGERFALYHLETSIGPPGTTGDLRCGPPRPVCPGVLQQPPQSEVRYGVRAAPAVEDDAIDRSGVRADGNAVSIPLTSAGSDAFARLSKEVARVGGRDQGWHHIAVVVGDEIVAFPEIDFDVYPNGIPNAPSLQLTTASAQDAQQLVERLRRD